MKRRTQAIFLLSLAAAAAAACGGVRAGDAKAPKTVQPSPATPSPSPGQDTGEDILEISLGVSAPFSNANVVIDGKGNLSYTASVYAPVEAGAKDEARNVTLTPEQLGKLKGLIVETKIFSLDSAKWQTQGQDCTSGGITIKTKEGQQSFGCVCGCPEEYDRIQAAVEELLGQPILQIGF